MAGLKLYYSPGACSLAPSIALEETGVAFEPVLTKLADGAQKTPEFLALNPKGRVPVLADGDFVVTENPAILRYIARSFIAPSQELRARAVHMKFNPLRENVAGKRIVVVNNLQPAILRGETSNGMLLAATSGEKVVLLTPDDPECVAGAKIK